MLYHNALEQRPWKNQKIHFSRNANCFIIVLPEGNLPTVSCKIDFSHLYLVICRHKGRGVKYLPTSNDPLSTTFFPINNRTHDGPSNPSVHFLRHFQCKTKTYRPKQT